MPETPDTAGRGAHPEATRPADDARAAPRTPARAARAFPTFLQALGLMAVALLLQGVLAVAMQVLDPTSGELARHPLALAFANLIAFGAVILGATRLSRAGFAAVCPLSPVSGRTLGLVAVLLLGTVILLSDVDNLTRSFFPPPEALTELFESIMNTGEHPLSSFFLLVVVAPVTEEVLFRGIILRGFLANYPKRRAILLSALLFALMHTNPWQFISTFVAGVLLAWLLVETGSLVPCLFAHAVANATAYLAGLMPVEVPGFTGGMGEAVQFQPFWLNALGIVLVVAGYGLLRRTLRDNPRPPGALRRPGATP